MKKPILPLVSAGLRVFGVSHHHQELEQVLNIKATASHSKGDEITDFPWLKRKTWPHDVWVIEAPIEPTRPLAEHLRWIVKRFKKHSAYLRRLVAKGADIDITCTCVSDQRSVSLVIDSALLKGVSELGCPLTVKIISVAELWRGFRI